MFRMLNVIREYGLHVTSYLYQWNKKSLDYCLKVPKHPDQLYIEKRLQLHFGHKNFKGCQ